jgi:uncharacterized protein (TIGR02246 family)
MRRLTVVLCALAVAGVWTRASAQMGGDAKAGVAKVRENYMKAVNAGDAKGVAMLYTPDGVEMPPNQPMVKGRAALEAYHQKLAAMMDAKLTITGMDTSVHGDTAIDVGTYSQTLTPKGGKPIQDTGKYVVILRQSGGSWWAAYAIYNSDLPPNPALAPAMK